ncbi:receptor-like protein 7 [Nymphaea colorata]|nr:receptor-like protein 7 [Nymphaea colorata]
MSVTAAYGRELNAIPQTGCIIGLQLHGRTTSESTPRVFLDIDPELEDYEYNELKVNGHADPRDISRSRIPSALFELHQLQHLDHSGCDFNGSAIPSQLAQLTHLTHLNLSRAWFSGQTIEVSNNHSEGGISDEIGDLKRLQQLRISNNKLKGPIPKSIGALSHLESLDLSHSYISGEIPEELTTLNSLGYLNLSHNNLSGRILQSPHFSTFDALCFEGNPSLCGAPLSLACEANNGAKLLPFVGLRETDEEKMRKIDGGATGASSCLGSEASILLRIKEGLHLSNGRLSSWGGNESNCCLWEGVECDPQTGRIIGLQLRGRTTSESTPRVILDIDPELEWHDYGVLKVNGHADPRDISGSRVPPALFELHHLQRLDLYGCDFNGSAIPSQLAQLTHLTSPMLGFQVRLPHLQALDLSYNNYLNGTLMPSFFPPESNLQSLRLALTSLSGHIPTEVFELPLLKVLDLTYSTDLSGPLPTKLPKSKLQILKLSNIMLSGGFPSWIVNLTSLVELDLSRTDLSGSLPITIGNLRCLRSLDLWSTNLSGNLPTTIGDLTALTHLDLHGTGLSGNLPTTIGDLTALAHLDLSYAALSGNLPITMANLTALTHLSLSSTPFSGSVPFMLGGLTTLIHLDLSGCNYTSIDSSLFANLTHLTYLDLSGNMFSGSLPSLPYHLRSAHLNDNNFSGPIPNSYSLLNIEILDLSRNSMTGTLPSSLTHGPSFMQSPIQYLDLSNNKFHGYLNLGIFAHLKNLYFLSLSKNNWTVDVHDPTLKFPSLQELRLVSCNINQLPQFLLHHKPIETLDLSKNMIFGEIPKWLRLSRSLIISYNKITSIEEEIFLNIEKLDLSYNMLNRLPKFLSPNRSFFDNMEYFSVKNNSVTGEIPTSLCNFTMLLSLDLSNNKLSGQIPDCLFHMDLVEVKLQNNQLQGQIPEFDCQTRTELKTLDLSANRFVGYIPTSLGNCKNLEFINLGYNKLSGEFPSWIAKLPQLKIFVLKSNSLNGAINFTVDKNMFQELLVLDISTNQFTGKFPLGLLLSLNAMKSFSPESVIPLHFMSRYSEGWGGTIGSKESELTDGFYEDWEVTLNTKGINLTYERGMLSIMKTIEISNNYFEDEISEEIGDLEGLQALRISNNKLKGPIPKSIGALTHLESLDLSHNYLSGEIPEELNALNSLGYLNLSYNNLSGRIPQSPHFSTFGALSFEGNPSLCGPPLSLGCDANNGATLFPFVGLGKRDEETMWKYISMGLGFGAGFGTAISFSYFLNNGRGFNSFWRRCYWSCA